MDASRVALVKSFPSDPIVRYIFEENNDYVKLCSEEGFRLWRGKRIRPLAVRCPKSRVFSYAPELYAKLKEAAYAMEDEQLLDALWEHAQPYYDNLEIKVNSNVR